MQRVESGVDRERGSEVARNAEKVRADRLNVDDGSRCAMQLRVVPCVCVPFCGP